MFTRIQLNKTIAHNMIAMLVSFHVLIIVCRLLNISYQEDLMQIQYWIGMKRGPINSRLKETKHAKSSCAVKQPNNNDCAAASTKTITRKFFSQKQVLRSSGALATRRLKVMKFLHISCTFVLCPLMHTIYGNSCWRIC